MENENATGAATTDTSVDAGAASSTTESVVSDDFDVRSPAEIEASRQQEESTVDTTVDEEVEEEAEATDESTNDSTTQTSQSEATANKTEAPSNQEEKSQLESVFREAKQLDIKLPVDEFGNLDVQALPNFVQEVMEAAGKKAESVIQQRVYIAEEMDRVEATFPELAKDPARMSRVQALRTADVVTGGDGDLMRIAKEYMDDIGMATQAGKESQKVHVTRQKSARLETSTRTGAKGESAKLQRLTEVAFGQNSSRAQREDARIARIRILREQGKL